MTHWWNTKYGKDKICGITHSRLRPGHNKNGQSYVVWLQCNHGFYRKPLEIWLKTNNTCPICRRDVNFKV